MKVTLVGPDDLGCWFLHDANGNSFPLIESHEDQPAAAALFGWTAPEGVTGDDALIDSAIDFLMENTGEEFKAPKHVVGSFKKLEAENEE